MFVLILFIDKQGIGQTIEFFLKAPGKIGAAGKTDLEGHFGDITEIRF